MTHDMKNTLLIILAALTAIAPAFAGTISKTYPLEGFTGIQASHIYRVHLTPSPDYYVSIEAPDYLEPYLTVSVSRNQLVLRVTNLPKAIERRLSKEKAGSIRAEVSMPVLESVTLSGASSLVAEGDFPVLRGRPFKMDVSGAAKASGLSVQAGSMDIRMSGAASASISGGSDDVDLEASGASKTKMRLTVTRVKADLSGSADLDLGGAFDRVSIEASGASHAKLESTSTLSTLNLQCSGASSVNTRDAMADDVSVELSGASNCKVNAIRRIEVEASGASTCSYEAAPGTRLDIIQVSRGSTLKKL